MKQFFKVEIEDVIFFQRIIYLLFKISFREIFHQFSTKLLYRHMNTNLVPLIIFFILPFSDSFTISETSILTALIQISTIIQISTKQHKPMVYFTCFFLMLITRIYDFSGVCRIEQGDFCNSYFYIQGTSKTSLYALPILLLTTMSTLFLNNQQFLFQKLRKSLAIGFIAAFLYWTLDTLEILESYKLFLPWIYFIAIYYLRQREDLPFVLFFFVTAIQKPVAAIMMHMMYLQYTLVQYFESQGIEMDVGFLVGLKLFFATGHQFTFTSIMWDVGFIGIRKVNLVSAGIVALNTLGGIFSTWALYGKKHVKEVGFNCTMTMIGCAILKTHHKVWAAFTPRMCYFWIILIVIWVTEYVHIGVDKAVSIYKARSKRINRNKNE